MYHVMSRGHERSAIFREDGDREKFHSGGPWGQSCFEASGGRQTAPSLVGQQEEPQNMTDPTLPLPLAKGELSVALT